MLRPFVGTLGEKLDGLSCDGSRDAPIVEFILARLCASEDGVILAT